MERSTKKEIRQMSSQELKFDVEERVKLGGISMTNYERSQYCRKLKAEGKLKETMYRESDRVR